MPTVTPSTGVTGHPDNDPNNTPCDTSKRKMCNSQGFTYFDKGPKVVENSSGYRLSRSLDDNQLTASEYNNFGVIRKYSGIFRFLKRRPRIRSG